MKVIVLSKIHNRSEMRETPFIPRVGDHVDIWCRPNPVVKQVIAWPNTEVMRSLGVTEIVDAMILVE